MNNWKIAIRNFRKNKFYGLINVAGLTVGLAACFLIIMYLQHEMGFDQFFKDSERIYQVNVSARFGGDEYDTSNTPPPVGEALAEEFPEVESYTRFHMPGDLILRNLDRKFTESNIWLVDSNFLEFFSFALMEGDAATCLEGTRSIVLTENMAQKYFGTASALGKEIFMEEEVYTVTGVLKNLPQLSSLQFDALAPIASSRRVDFFSWSWIWLQVDTYVKLAQPLDAGERSALEAKFPPMVRKNAASAYKRLGQDIDEFFRQGNRWELSLTPLEDVHLYTSGIGGRLTTKSDIRDVYIFGTIGFFILLLACINFMNLSTARSMGRAREVGVRKVLGSQRSGLIWQFMTEAMLYSFVAALLAIALSQVMLPMFNQMMDIELGVPDLLSGWSLTAFLVLPVLAGLLAGSYPSFYLSKFKPVAVLKSKIPTVSGSHAWVRSSLVVFQFAISVTLVICTLIVLQQINYSTNGDLGMDKENVLVIRNAQLLGEKAKSFKNEMQNLPEVSHASIATDLPAIGWEFTDYYIPERDATNPDLMEDLSLSSYMVDDDFIPVVGFEIIEGRGFNDERGLDSLAVIVNEETVRMVGWENPIGKRLTYPGGRNETYEVVGVIKDFHARSMQYSIEPFALFHESSKSYDLEYKRLAVKIASGSERRVLDKAKALWTSFAPNAPFGFSFLDDEINALYQSEERLGTVLSSFTFLSIFVACLGLLGLIAYTTEQRTKEIGIRKVLGASTVGIVGLLSKDFFQLVIFALILAAPVAYFFMKNWLQDFAYPVDIEWWVFALAGLVALLVTFLTVGFQSVKAALANPVESLRSE
ncbi:MAG: ABC transporter permease [Bacteroidota bacterium]